MAGRIIILVLKHLPFYLKLYFTVCKYAKHPEKYSITERYAIFRNFVVKIMKQLKVDIKTYNMENLRNHKGQFLGVSNHRFLFDPLFYIFINKEPISFIAKIEAKKMPLISKFLKMIDGYFIDRDDLISQVRTFKEISKHAKETGINYYIFPEGTRMKDKTRIQTLPFKNGSLKLAAWTNIDAIPFAMLNTENIFSKRKKKQKLVPIYIECLKPISANELNKVSTTLIMPKIEKDINNALIKLDDIRSQQYNYIE